MVVTVKFSPRKEKARKDLETAREAQEDRIDGLEVIAAGPRPHEEDLSNELLQAKEQTVAAVVEGPAVVAEQAPTLSGAAPTDLQAAVQVAKATEQALAEPVPDEPTAPTA